MVKVEVSNLKTSFLELLDRVSRGEHIIITKYGIAIAILAPVGAPS